MAQLYDLASLWRKRCVDLRCATVPGGHFFVDQSPLPTAEILVEFLHETNEG